MSRNEKKDNIFRLDNAGLASRTKAKLPASGGKLGPLAEAAPLISEIARIIRTCTDCAQEIARCRTETARITESARVQIAVIQSRRDVLVTFLERTFEERKDNFRALFERLDTALQQQSLEGAQAVLDTIVNLAKESPFQALKDAAEAHKVLLDKDVTWVL